MRQKFLGLVTLCALAACGSDLGMPSSDVMEDHAKEYLFLELSMGQHDPGHVDAYFGPEEIRASAIGAQLPLDEIRRLLDEQHGPCAPRQRLKAERPGAGEQVEHARVFYRIIEAMRQDVEYRLAQPVARRPDRLAFGAGEGCAAQPTADDPHRRPVWSHGARPRRNRHRLPPPAAGR